MPFLRARFAALSALAWSSSALAAPVTLEFAALAELTAGGWTHHEGGTTTLSGGKLVVTGATFEEWALNAGVGQWWQGSLANGWVVEARLRIVAGQADCKSTGFWVSDGAHVTKVQLSTTWAGISYPSAHGIDLDTTSASHLYRLQYLGQDRYHFLVDGKLVADVHQLDQGAGSNVLMFGDLGGCQGATSEWDSFTYDTVAQPIIDGDADGDGIANALDTCATNADPSNADADNDGDGDLCDRCPDDPKDDADRDGICANDDACPDDARNDTDGNGVCDTEECSAIEAAAARCSPQLGCNTPIICPAACVCIPPVFGVDPVWSLDNGLLTPPYPPLASAPTAVGTATNSAGSAAATSSASAASASHSGAQDLPEPAPSHGAEDSGVSPSSQPSGQDAAVAPDSATPTADPPALAPVVNKHSDSSSCALAHGPTNTSKPAPTTALWLVSLALAAVRRSRSLSRASVVKSA